MMKRYKRKPSFVDAQQWFPGVKIDGFCIKEAVHGPNTASSGAPYGAIFDAAGRACIGKNPIIEEGEWFIKHQDGTIEHMPHEQFQARYEELEIRVPEC